MVDHRRDSLIVQTAIGPLEVVVTSRGVSLVSFHARGKESPLPTGKMARAVIEALQEYAAGKDIRFQVPIDLSSGTTFQQAVWRALTTIPRGETRSYGWVAQQIGRPRATRAVGSACGANPVAIIVPCHRVIAGDGSLGGFGGGLEMKKRLLALESSKGLF